MSRASRPNHSLEARGSVEILPSHERGRASRASSIQSQSAQARARSPSVQPVALGKVALITGISGQDGSYLAEFLLKKGYEVHGIIRRSSSFNTGRIDHIFEKLHLHYGDLIDSTSLQTVISKCEPDEVYHLAAQSHVKVSFEMPEYTGETTGLGAVRLLEAIRNHTRSNPHVTIKFYQASSSELFGKAVQIPQNEETPFYPRSPYGVAKAYAYWIVKNYRESYNMFAVNGILFNHESPRRGGTFVTKKITSAIADIWSGHQQVLKLGNLDAKRDWGHARDYVEAMWLMLQQETPDDFVISTGEQHSVRYFCELCFAMAGRPIRWEGEGNEEIGVDCKSGKIYVVIDPRYYRPSEVQSLLGDSTKAEKKLNWRPKSFIRDIAFDMMKADFTSRNLVLPNDAMRVRLEGLPQMRRHSKIDEDGESRVSRDDDSEAPLGTVDLSRAPSNNV
eukprot:gene577-101_t